MNEAIRKDHYPVLFIDQMLYKIAGEEYYCFLDIYLGYNDYTRGPVENNIHLPVWDIWFQENVVRAEWSNHLLKIHDGYLSLHH